MTANVSALVPLVSVALKATLLLALAAILDSFVLRRASAAARHQVWTFAVVGVLVLPALVWTLPSWRAAMPGIAAMRVTDRTRGASLTPPLRTNNTFDNDVVASVQPTPSTSRSPVTRTVTSDDHARFAPQLVPWTRLILVVYVAGVLLMLARVIGEQFYVRRLARQAGPERDREWTALLDATAARLGIRRRIGLLRSSEPMMPITWGIVRPFVMVPAGSSTWPAARREAVLVHELSHVARHDCLTQTLAAVACAVYWPHPGVWFAAKRLRVERELACDDQVVTGGMNSRDYAGHLLEIARTLHPPRPLAALAVGMATASHIEMRLRAAIDDTRRRTPPTHGVRLMSATAAAVLVLPLAAFRVATVQASQSLNRLPTVVVTARALEQQAVAQRVLEGTYDIRLAGPAEAGLQGVGTVIHISMFTPGLNTFYTPLSEFVGLSITQMEAMDLAAQFALRRGPGTFTFTGRLNHGQGKGRFTFVPDPSFGAELVKRGMQPPTDEQQFTLARHGVGLEMLDELAAQGYATPTTAALVRASSSGPELDELRALATLGYTFGTLESVTRFHSNGVSADYIRELGTAGYRRLTPSELTQARSHSVTAEFANQVNARAGRRLSISELVSLRSRGEGETSTTESPSITTANTPGTNATPPVSRVAAEPTALAGTWTLANTGGPELELGIDWDGSNQWARRINAAELRGLPATAATTAAPAAFRLEQDAGVFEFEGTFQSGRGTGRFRFRPNHSFAATVRSLGVQDVDDLSDHELKNLAFSGVSAAAIRELMALGVTPLTRRDLVDLAVRQVTPAYVRGLRAAGLADGTPVADIIELRFIGVTPAYLSELTRKGDHKLTGSQVLDLWRARR